MSNLNRRAKSAIDWTIYDLHAYNISVTHVSPEQFFPQGADAPLIGLDPALINAEIYAKDVSGETGHLFAHLNTASHPSCDPENMVFNFVWRLMYKNLGFEERRNLLSVRRSISWQICADITADAQIDVCLMDQKSMILLIVQVEKTSKRLVQPQAQVTAAAIAVYQHNHIERARRGLHPLNDMTVPCISMDGTRPVFYLVPIKKVLSDAVKAGQWPSVKTEVLMCVTLGGHFQASEGMETPEYRRVALQRFIAFKALAQSHWERFLAD